MDDADRAQVRIEQELERAIEAARLGGSDTESASNCMECDEQIPSERQIAVPGCQLCADCAAELERLDHRARKAGL